MPVALLVVLAAGAAAAACGGSGGASVSPRASPSSAAAVAFVDGRVVRQGDLESVRAERRLLGRQDVETSALDEAIDRALVRGEAERLGIKADAALVGARVAALASQLGGAARLAAALERARMSEAQLRWNLEDALLRESVADARFSGLSVDDATVRRYYRRHRSDVFTTPASAKLKVIPVRSELIAENALTRLREGRSFAEVARQFSADPESKANGGDIGWVLLRSLPAPLRRAVRAAGKGMIARPVRAGGLWYVVDVAAWRPVRVVPFAAALRRLREELTRVKRAKALGAWLKEARVGESVERL